MRKLNTVLFLTLFFTAGMTLPALAANSKVEGDTVLKDSQTAGVPNKHDKHQKHQVFDLIFDANGNEYICRTDSDKSMNATEFVVGSRIHYEMNGKKVKIITLDNKKVGCQVVRVAVVSPQQ
jgi:hypothetical protein